jgi:hypothetical protein
VTNTLAYCGNDCFKIVIIQTPSKSIEQKNLFKFNAFMVLCLKIYFKKLKNLNGTTSNFETNKQVSMFKQFSSSLKLQ